jgi:hypothetical protein
MGLCPCQDQPYVPCYQQNTLIRYRSRRPPKSNTEFSLACAEQKEMIPPQIFPSIKCRRQRSASLTSLDKKDLKGDIIMIFPGKGVTA